MKPAEIKAWLNHKKRRKKMDNTNDISVAARSKKKEYWPVKNVDLIIKS